MDRRILLCVAAGLVFWLGAFTGGRHYAAFEKACQQERLDKARMAAWERMRIRLDKRISEFTGRAGVVVMDLDTGWEYKHKENEPFAAASLAKVPVMAAAYKAAEEGRIRLDRNIALKQGDKLTGSGLLKIAPAGTVFSVRRLIGLMIYDSDNTATNIVTGLVGLDYINDAIAGFGLKNSALARRIADYQARDKGKENYTTAGDMALLLQKMYDRTLVSRSVCEQCLDIMRLTRGGDRIPRYLPVDLTIAHKTGLERGVCHDAGIIFTPRSDLLVAVLTGHDTPGSAPSKDLIADIALIAYEYLGFSAAVERGEEQDEDDEDDEDE